MKIRQLDVTGFKSFVDQTTVAFPEGISAVVGPNGCGKSNIVDALRWVMGEQSVKMLRGKAMEDVIFSGAEKRPPLNAAEVTLTLENDNGNTPEQFREFSEIMVSRRLFRSGESGYFINKQPCRLKDIQNLLMGSGVGSRTYAVVEQGRISTLIDAGPEERRLFVEEAAGTTRYRSRKDEALRKIERTQHNLLRISDVIVEIKRQMNGLKRQARKAERFKAYQEQIQRLEIGLASHHYQTVCAEIRESDTLLEALKDKDHSHGAQLAKLDAAIEQIKQERAVKHREISEHKGASYQLQRTIDKIEQDLEYGTKDLERLAIEAEQLRAEINEVEQKDREVNLECQHIEERTSVLQQDIERTEETVKQEEPAEQALKDGLAELNQTLETQKAELMDLSTRKAAYQNTLQNTSQNKETLARRLENIRKEKGQTQAERSRIEKGLTKVNAALDTLKEEISEISQGLESSEKQLTQKRDVLANQVREVQTMEAEKQKIRSRHAALKKMDENYEWYKEGVRAIMTKSASKDHGQNGIHGLVADVIETEATYEVAVEAALGEALQYVIVQDQQGGVAAIDYLHAQSAGRSGFIPMQSVRPIVDAGEGLSRESLGEFAAGVLTDHIKVKAGYENVIQFLLGHVVIAEDLTAALQLWNKNGVPHTVVTQKGDRVCSQGILIGGSSKAVSSGILSKKKEIRELSKQLSRLETSVAEGKAIQEQLESEAIALEAHIQKSRQIQRQKTQEEMDREKELYRFNEGLKHIHHRLEVLDLEVQQIEGEETDLDRDFSKYQEVVSGLSDEIQTAATAISEKNAEAGRVSADLETAHQRIVTLRLELTKLQAQHDNSQNTLRRLRGFKDERLTKLSHLTEQLKQKGEDKTAVQQRMETDRDKMARLYAELESSKQTLDGMEAQYQTIEKMLEENDRELSNVGSAQQEALQKIQQLELKQTERRMRREHLVSRIRENYQQDIERSGVGDDTEEVSVEEMEVELTRLREQIVRMGEVNPAAIEEYETLEERFQFLTEQRDDLLEATEALRRVIRKINRTSLRRFMKTFRAANEKLEIVFPKLFEGGKAKLVLTDPKKPLESGVSFFVHPPGKRLTRMSLLSGGEKALAAIALIFSLFLIKPTAFCVFDEIDAPLDDANIYRFNSLLRQIGEESQVIMVTHNKQTMEVADALFGVTMEDKGISKLISINLQSEQPRLSAAA
ncbi:MAG: chromosome segregation protein SMC [Deltaproteobacteria bacterium]|nr:chromosome segregation protein SMC [Deltaproteobacteria bacterium]